MSSFKQGYFKPKNPQKYRGRADGIVYRSSYELKFFMYLDGAADVMQWASEESFMIVPYRDPSTGRQRRYFPDVWFKKTDGQEFLVEIKPSGQTKPPPRSTDGKISKKYMKAAMTFATNQAKWDAAQKVCEAKNMTFQIITEKHLNIK